MSKSSGEQARHGPRPAPPSFRPVYTGATIYLFRTVPEYQQPPPEIAVPKPPRRKKVKLRLVIKPVSLTAERMKFGEEMREKRARRVSALFVAQDGCCYLCAEPFNGESPTIEHVHPRSRGGRSSSNILLAHGTCNVRKGNRLPTILELEYLRRINAKLDPTLWAAFGAEDHP